MTPYTTSLITPTADPQGTLAVSMTTFHIHHLSSSVLPQTGPGRLSAVEPEHWWFLPSSADLQIRKHPENELLLYSVNAQRFFVS